MTEKPLLADIGGTDKWKRLTPDQRRAVIDEFIGIVPPEAIIGDAASCADFLYDDRGMPSSDD